MSEFDFDFPVSTPIPALTPPPAGAIVSVWPGV
jgi:hypothetical protein